VNESAASKKQSKSGILLHGEADFASMRAAGRLAAETLDMITPHVKVGVTTEELNTLCHDFITQRSAIPAPLNYHGFPKSICTSINHVVCHGIPGPKKLMNGDIINIDVTVILDGWHGDSSRMYVAGDAPVKAKRLIDITYDAMMAGIEAVRPGEPLGNIGKAIQKIAEGARFSVVRDFCGHGLGLTFHAEPQILHYYDASSDRIIMEPGMFFTIEPMINTGTFETKVLADGWTAVTRDKGLSAQFEHSLAVTETGYEIFTLSPLGYHKPPYTVS